ncbi:MAG: hypothetical protein OXG74_00775 [Acidobacteria bacterium]|nr:hypothetical protein [Acidobacteriota bacterium]
MGSTSATESDSLDLDRLLDAKWVNLIEAKHPALYRVLLAAMTDSDKSYLAYMTQTTAAVWPAAVRSVGRGDRLPA